MKPTLIVVCIANFLQSGCAYPTITPRQNFDEGLAALVGKNLSEHENQPGYMESKDRLIRSEPLPNGNVRNFYKQLFRARNVPFECIYVLEYDPKTNIVVSTRIDSGAEACFTPL